MQVQELVGQLEVPAACRGRGLVQELESEAPSQVVQLLLCEAVVGPAVNGEEPDAGLWGVGEGLARDL